MARGEASCGVFNRAASDQCGQVLTPGTTAERAGYPFASPSNNTPSLCTSFHSIATAQRAGTTAAVESTSYAVTNVLDHALARSPRDATGIGFSSAGTDIQASCCVRAQPANHAIFESCTPPRQWKTRF